MKWTNAQKKMTLMLLQYLCHVDRPRYICNLPRISGNRYYRGTFLYSYQDCIASKSVAETCVKYKNSI